MTAIPDGLATALADRYRIERELGKGGMATEYAAVLALMGWDVPLTEARRGEAKP